jgi:CRP-like cAMP-binding protein
MRDAKKRLKELGEAVKREPGSIPKRLELAAALREVGRNVEAIDFYRGVAEVYAEEGRLVQAMAVCKGILEIDPEHRDTLEMLADLANKRAARPRGEAEIRKEGARWVAQPSGGTAGDHEETSASGDKWSGVAASGPLGEATPPDSGPLWGSALYDDEEVDEVPGEDTDPGADKSGTDPGIAAPLPEPPHTVVARKPGSAPRPVDALTGAPLPDDDARPPALEGSHGVLDFPPEVKAHARGDRLLAFKPREPTEVIPPPPQVAVPERRDTEPMSVSHSEKFQSLAVDVESDSTKAGTPRALESGRPPAAAVAHDEGALSWDDESENQVLADALASPIPRGDLGFDPPPFPLLSDLPRGAFMELLARMSLVRLGSGEMVLREGEAGDACYLIVSGQVRVLKAGIEVARLGPGSFFGEFAVLADQRRHASVETVEEVELLEIRRALLDELVAAHPGVARTLRAFYRERLMSTLLATAPFFSQLSAEERKTIAERFRPRRFGRGAHIIDEGAAGGGLYLILVGEVVVVRGTGKEEMILGKLGEGSYFGEMSLLKGGVASATVRASRMTEVVQLPPRDFYEIVSQHPVLWEQLRSEAERRELANHTLVTGEARDSGDGSVYLL